MIDLTKTNAREIARRVNEGEVKAVEVARAALERIEQLNPRFNAFLTVTNEEALRAAEAVDKTIATGESLPLAGVPLAIKDSFWTKGVRTTNGSKALAEFVPEEDATAVARLKEAGCVLVGKASMHEFAYGFTGQNPHFGDARNPWNPDLIPGGSSGGCAIALTTGMALAAVGGDTGGSVRQPAALCGVVGLKVTYGRVSRFGGIPLSWTMDTVGPMARTVGDAALMLQAMAGPDPKDDTTEDVPALPSDLIPNGNRLDGIRVGVPHNHFFENADPEVSRLVIEAIDQLKRLGAETVDTVFPSLDPVRGAHRGIIFSEATTAHESIARDRNSALSDDVRSLLLSGLFITAPQYLAAQQARRKIISEYRELWKSFDVLATPTSPIAATPIGMTDLPAGDQEIPLVYLYLDYTLPFNLTGQPALSVPCGFTQTGLPIGLQLIGRPFSEATLLRVGSAYESSTDWHTRTPTL